MFPSLSFSLLSLALHSPSPPLIHTSFTCNAQPRQHKFELKTPQELKGAFGTFRNRRPKQTVSPLPHEDSPENEGGGEPSPGASSTPPSPRFLENGVASPDKRKTSSTSSLNQRSRTSSTPGETPPRPPKRPPRSSPSLGSIHPIPDRATSHSPPVIIGGSYPRLGPKPSSDRKISGEKPMFPLPPLPDNDMQRDKNSKAPAHLPRPDNSPQNHLKPPPVGLQPPLPDAPPLPPRDAPPIPMRSAGKQVEAAPPLPPKNK